MLWGGVRGGFMELKLYGQLKLELSFTGGFCILFLLFLMFYYYYILLLSCFLIHYYFILFL